MPTPDDYAYVMDTNQRGAFFVAQEAAKRMIARHKGDPRKQHRIKHCFCCRLTCIAADWHLLHEQGSHYSYDQGDGG
jgi:NAD(P)-dependent dehydrogenase (short-subunit alcohol dehydrogenase family)